MLIELLCVGDSVWSGVYLSLFPVSGAVVCFISDLNKSPEAIKSKLESDGAFNSLSNQRQQSGCHAAEAKYNTEDTKAIK